MHRHDQSLKDNPPPLPLGDGNSFCIRQAVVDAFDAHACPVGRTLDFETLKQHLIDRHADKIFTGASSQEERKTLLDKFTNRLSRYINRNAHLFAKGPKLYSAPLEQL